MKPRRFTIRAIVIVVAIAALATWGYAMRLRWQMFTAKAREHYNTLIGDQIDLFAIEYKSGSIDDAMQGRRNFTAAEEAEIAIRVHQIGYEEQMYHKYARAARYPWLPLEPDPARPTPP